jgi:putative transposase
MATPKHRTARGCSYFVTTKCWEGRAVFQVAENAEILIQTMLHYRDSGAYLLHEFIVMPDHLHVLITPGETTSLERAVQLIKGGSSHRIHLERGQKMEIWQVGFHDWTIRDAEDWRAKVEYIRLNPVRARLVDEARAWAYSSANGRFVLDAMPEKFVASGAKAQGFAEDQTRGLKPPPPKERTTADVDAVPQGLKPLPPRQTAEMPPIPQGLKPVGSQGGTVRTETQTPGARTKASGAKAQLLPQRSTRGLKSPPPNEKRENVVGESGRQK